MLVAMCLTTASALRLMPPKAVPGSNWSTIGDAGPLQLNGSASLGGGAIKLTSNSQNQVGSAFRKVPVDVTAWETTFSFRLQGTPGETADGITFCIQNDERGPKALGSAGGYLGYGIGEYWETPGISKSVAIKFDDYHNSEFGDLSDDHIGVSTNGDIRSHVMVPAPFALDSGTVTVRITYYEQMLTVYVSNESDLQFGIGTGLAMKPVLRYHIDISAVLGSEIGYIGFTGATAWFFQSSEILSWTFAKPMRWEGPPCAGDATVWDDR